MLTGAGDLRLAAGTEGCVIKMLSTGGRNIQDFALRDFLEFLFKI